MKWLVWTMNGRLFVFKESEGGRLASAVNGVDFDPPVRVDRVLGGWPVAGAGVEWAETQEEHVARIRPQVVPPDAPWAMIAPEDLPAERDERSRWKVENGAVVVDEEAPLPRLTVPSGRVKLELNDRGLYAQAKALAEALGSEGVVYWSDFKDWESDHPKVLAIGAALDPPQDAAAVRAIFAAAAARDA